MKPRVYIFDTTLRDGQQTQGVDFSVTDKRVIARALDEFGVDYIEGGWPGANPTDDAFFADPPQLSRAKFVAFGMTKRPGRSADNDPGLAAVIGAPTDAACIVAKSWTFHVENALGITHDENLELIHDSIDAAVKKRGEAMLDAEHFFDGYKADPDFALSCLKAAIDAGARWVVLCDTNGGTLPHEVSEIVGAVTRQIDGERLGIHAHNDTENAVANTLAAVAAGVRQVQGTINGLGERCGNANLMSVIPNLALKQDYDIGVPAENLHLLTHLSRLLDDRLNRMPQRNLPYVGESAFAHKGGLHVSAVAKDPSCYEHIEPSLVGNQRSILVSDQAGKSNILARFNDIGVEVDAKDERVGKLVELVKQREYDGYAYDGAEASFELLARRHLGEVPEYFRLESFRVLDERRWNAKGELVTMSEATAKVNVAGQLVMTVAEGNGPVNALDEALRKALTPVYPELEGIRLVDFKVRILTPGDGTRAITRVQIETAAEGGEYWTTIGISPNIVDAAFKALNDSITFRLFHRSAPSRLAAE